MITKERLEELINEKAIVYYKGGRKKPQIYKWSGYWFTDYSIFHSKLNIWYELRDLFETKEEAEWELEFGNISRTETLNLPTWKKIKRKPTIINFMSKDWKLCKLALGEIVAVIGNGTKSAKKKYVCVRIDKNDYYFERTEKGYIEACKLCKKLFLGEKI